MTATAQGSDDVPPASTRSHRWKRRGLTCLAVLIVLLVGVELFARFYLGLGDPPLSVADPDIEYLFKPDQHCKRFGNTITYNRYSMRATPDFPKQKQDPNEFRVLMIGDSVINGGALTDDAELGSALLAKSLTRSMSRPVIVANISAGSWGPQNMLAYVKRYGLFDADADAVVIVLSSHDASDVMTFAATVGVSPSFPDHAPLLALQEAVTRYLLPRLFTSAPPPNEGPQTQSTQQESDTATSLAALTELIHVTKSRGPVTVFLHPTQTELATGPDPKRARLATAARDAGAKLVDMLDLYRSQTEPAALYRDGDDIHLNSDGQRLLSHVASDLLEPSTRP